MTLDSILKPFKLVDEQVLRQYTRLTKKWENKGRSKYSLAHIFNLSAIGSSLTPWCVNSYGLGFLVGTDLARNLFNRLERKDISEDGTIAEPLNIALYYYKKLADITRLPSLLFGLTFIGKGGFELVDYLKTNNSNSLSNALQDISLGYTFAGVASSMYIKDSNPKLLEKQPFWKIAYEKVKNKVKDLIPEPNPVPNPIPVQACNNLENYVERT